MIKHMVFCCLALSVLIILVVLVDAPIDVPPIDEDCGGQEGEEDPANLPLEQGEEDENGVGTR